MSEVQPVAEQRRIKSLDTVRGLALLGILAVNAAYFAMPMPAAQNPMLPPTAIDDDTVGAWFTMHVFFEFKMITLFSMLFGASIFMVGGERSDKDRGAILHRRLGWLLLIGVIHGALIWYGDILLTYALTGMLVMFARSWKPMTLLIVGIVVTMLGVGLFVGMGVALGYAPPEALEEVRADVWAPPAEEVARIITAYQAGALSATAANLNAWLEFLGFTPIFMIRTAGVMMIGMALFKWGFFSGNVATWVYVALSVIGAGALAVVAWQAQMNYAAAFPFVHMMGPGNGANFALSPLIALFYASALILIVKSGLLRIVTDALAAVGRMAFTNYLTQSLIMTTIFYGGRGFGLYGEVSREQLWGIVGAIWVLQLIWSPLWLSRFSMGPFEWVWRRLSYGRPVSITKASGGIA